jgi:hypothetical protein
MTIFRVFYEETFSNFSHDPVGDRVFVSRIREALGIHVQFHTRGHRMKNHFSWQGILYAMFGILMAGVLLAAFGCGTDVHVGSGVEVCTGTECGDGHNETTETDTTTNN